MDKTTNQIISLLPASQQKEILDKAVVCLKEKMRVIVSNLPPDKLILAHDFLSKLGKQNIQQRPPPSYTSTPNDSDGEMPPLINDTMPVKNIDYRCLPKCGHQF